jgi:excisionase family DNA binding protein
MEPVARRQRPVLRLALTPEEAAEAIGVSRSFFFEHVLGELRVVRVGRKRFIAISELERYLDREASRAVD